MPHTSAPEKPQVAAPTVPRCVLVLGASGLIGAAVAARLAAQGAEIVAVARRPGAAQPNVRWRALDVARLPTADAWQPHLAGVDAVVNCAGALAQRAGNDLRKVHVDGIAALYTACERAGVRRVVQVSAAGVDRPGSTAFSATKKAGDGALMERALDWVILRPVIVVGRAAIGGSALLRGLAALPYAVELPNAGPLQIVQLDDLVSAIVFFLATDAPHGMVLDIASPERLTLAEAVACYRRWLGYEAARPLRVASVVAALVHRCGDLLSALGWEPAIGATVQAELARGVLGDSERWRAVTGIEPQSLATALAREPVSVQERWFARLYFARPFVLVVLAGYWIVTCLIAAGPGSAASLAYLRDAGVAGALAPVVVLAASLADLAVGVGIVLRRTARWALRAGLALAVAYAGAATFLAPQLWVDPLGPLLKILPIAALHVVALAIVDSR